MRLVGAYQESTANFENRLNGLIRFQLPEGSVEGVVSSFGVSLVVNMVFMRTLEGSIQGASLAVLFKVVQITLHLGLEHFYEVKNPLLPNARKTLDYPLLNVLVTTAGLIAFKKISALRTFCATATAILILNQSTYVALPNCIVLNSY